MVGDVCDAVIAPAGAAHGDESRRRPHETRTRERDVLSFGIAAAPTPPFPLVLAAISLVAGGLARLVPDLSDAPHIVWQIGLVLSGAPVVLGTIRGVLRGRLAADLVATLAIVTAAVFDQPVVGLIVVVMQTGGEALERFAQRRAAAATRALEEAAPRIAHRYEADALIDITADEIEVGDVLLVRPGELLPCDAMVEDGRSHVDVSALTGEPIPVTAIAGARLGSGSSNGEGALTIRALARSQDSEYARIVELVREAQLHKAPIQRLADRYAVWFTPFTITLAAAALLGSGEWSRVLAVLVVATPCPLILATPVAVIGGINRAARRRIVVRNGAALERVGAATVVVFDKTGTITVGRPAVSRVIAIAPFDETQLLRLAGSVEESSSHQLARSLVATALQREIQLPRATHVQEIAGRGVAGDVEHHRVAVGSRSFVQDIDPSIPASLDTLAGAASTGLRAYVAVDNQPAGIVDYSDAMRADFPSVRAELDAMGVRRVILLSGDAADKTRAVATAAGIREYRGDLSAADKAAIVKSLAGRGETVVMVGDGTNDAPALSTATVGVALAAHRTGVVASAADIVVLADDLGRVTEAMQISRRTMHIARQGLAVGLGLSIVGMLFAAAGALSPIAGAVFQEILDLAVIANALRAAR